MLDITGGLHQGVTLGLGRDTYSIGHADGADLILHDDAVAGLHLRLRLKADQLIIEALGGDVGVLGANARQPLLTIPRGHGHRTRLPVHLQVGHAHLAIRAPRGAAPAAPAWRKPQYAAGIALLLVTSAVFGLRQAPVEDFSVSLPAPAAAPRAVPDVEQAHHWLDAQLQQAGLGTITTAAGNHQISAQGTYRAAQKGSWAAVQQAFDKRYGQQWVLNANVTQSTAAATPQVRFQAVWFGNNPYVVDGRGRHLYPGAALEDNWLLERIESNQVLLVRGDERFTFTL